MGHRIVSELEFKSKSNIKYFPWYRNPKLPCEGSQIPRLNLNAWSKGRTSENLVDPEGPFGRHNRPNRPHNRPNKRPFNDY